MKIFIQYVDDSVVEGMVRAEDGVAIGDKFFSLTPDESMFGIPFSILRDNGVGEFISKGD